MFSQDKKPFRCPCNNKCSDQSISKGLGLQTKYMQTEFCSIKNYENSEKIVLPILCKLYYIYYKIAHYNKIDRMFSSQGGLQQLKSNGNHYKDPEQFCLNQYINLKLA